MKFLHHFLWVVAVFLIQFFIIKPLSIFGICGNIILCFVLSYGFILGRVNGTVIGFITGIIFDIFIGRLIGVYTLFFVLIGYFSAVLSDRFITNPSFYILSLIAFAATLLCEGLYIIPYNLMFPDINPFYGFFRIIVIEGVLNAILILPVFYGLKNTLKRYRILY